MQFLPSFADEVMTVCWKMHVWWGGCVRYCLGSPTSLEGTICN